MVIPTAFAGVESELCGRVTVPEGSPRETPLFSIQCRNVVPGSVCLVKLMLNRKHRQREAFSLPTKDRRPDEAKRVLVERFLRQRFFRRSEPVGICVRTPRGISADKRLLAVKAVNGGGETRVRACVSRHGTTHSRRRDSPAATTLPQPSSHASSWPAMASGEACCPSGPRTPAMSW